MCIGEGVTFKCRDNSHHISVEINNANSTNLFNIGENFVFGRCGTDDYNKTILRAWTGLMEYKFFTDYSPIISNFYCNRKFNLLNKKKKKMF